MGMSIEEIIAKEIEIAVSFQNTVDTHMVKSNLSLEEMYCDDTEVIEEELKRCKELSDYHNTIANIMYKYQKIEQIIDHYKNNVRDKVTNENMEKILEVIEDGKID